MGINVSLKKSLKCLNRDVFVIIDLEVEAAVKDLNDVYHLVVTDGMEKIPCCLTDRRTLAPKKVWHVIQQKESIFKQESRHKWIKGGDSNSKFFQCVIKFGFKRNGIVGQNMGRGRITQVGEVKMEIMNHFEKRFKEPLTARPLLEGVEFQRI